MKQLIVLLVEGQTVKRLEAVAERYGKTREGILDIACEAVAELADDAAGCVSLPAHGWATKNVPEVCHE